MSARCSAAAGFRRFRTSYTAAHDYLLEIISICRWQFTTDCSCRSRAGISCSTRRRSSHRSGEQAASGSVGGFMSWQHSGGKSSMHLCSACLAPYIEICSCPAVPGFCPQSSLVKLPPSDIFCEGRSSGFNGGRQSHGGGSG